MTEPLHLHGEATLRRVEGRDRGFLEQMLACAADWRASEPRPFSEVLADPELARYIDGWPADGDFGLIAESGRPVGAAWWRHFSSSEPGYGFVDDRTPEIAIGVVGEARGAGVGTLLLDGLVTAARGRGLARLSLSVEADNPARRLYERRGFEVVDGVEDSLTMVLVF